MAKEYLAGKDKEEWVDAKVYGPYANTQSLVYENAECFATKTLLKIVQLPFHYEERPNAEFMSNNGRVPILRLNNDNHIICGFHAISDFITQRGLNLADPIPDNQIGDLEAYMALIDDVLRNVEVWMCWKEKTIYKNITAERYGSTYHWPLNHFLPMIKKNEYNTYIKNIGWENKTLDEVIKMADSVFHSLSVKLGNNEYFFGNTPTQLDAYAFGHFYCITTTILSNNSLMAAIKKYENLGKFCQTIEKNFHKNK
uniref:GST N-terminal domain-containing protein n=1 Tax=Rhabditophanes sp. KR3021 TaxID=114890 RepID=A0AC35TUD3_9BILA